MKQQTSRQQEIRFHLTKVLTAAKKKIHLALGWINDDGIITLLENKAFSGLSVAIIVLEDTSRTKKALYEELQKKGIKVIALDKSQQDYFLDHKFGVIDDAVVLTGNYGWGHNNAPEDAFLNITEEVPTLATGFEKEFNHLAVSAQLSKNAAKPPNTIVDFLKKLAIIKTLLSIGDTEFLHLRLEPFQEFKSDKNVANILKKIEKKEFEEALALVKTFTTYHQPLRACIDPPIDSYKREIQLLENEIATLSNEFNATQKLLHKFSKMHTAILGDTLQQLLFQTKLKAQIEAALDASKQGEFEEAEKDHEEYTKSHEAAKKEKLLVLSVAEQKELKKLYRQTSMKCHPDRVVDELHDQAEEIFVELNSAYKANDLEKVREIHQQLKSGIMLPKSEGITELKKLASTCKSLAQKVKDWQDKLAKLKEEASFKTISKIDDWDFYFKDKKEVLIAQLERLKNFNKENKQTKALE